MAGNYASILLSREAENLKQVVINKQAELRELETQVATVRDAIAAAQTNLSQVVAAMNGAGGSTNG